MLENDSYKLIKVMIKFSLLICLYPKGLLRSKNQETGQANQRRTSTIERTLTSYTVSKTKLKTMCLSPHCSYVSNKKIIQHTRVTWMRHLSSTLLTTSTTARLLTTPTCRGLPICCSLELRENTCRSVKEPQAFAIFFKMTQNQSQTCRKLWSIC